MLKLSHLLILPLVLTASHSPALAESYTGGVKFEAVQLQKDNNEGCDIADIDQDGIMDLTAGRHWYPGPDFEKKNVRELAPFGKDYVESNGEHAYDVNGDGLPDVVSGSFVPTEVYWYENPGMNVKQYKELWKKHLLVDTGYSQNEVSFLRDLDGDGTPEYIVNSWGTENPLVAWIFDKDDEGQPTLRKFVLADEANIHGFGFGDVNGDGREDILTGAGWHERPEGDPFLRKWKTHKDWHFPECSTGMVVTDLNGDGRNDIVWGNGHDYGLYWEEQMDPDPDGKTRWKRHLIDKGFSQAHDLAWVDIDQDDERELITGKRYYGHSGGDPGANDPPIVLYYDWDSEKQKFVRHVIHKGSAGAGLQVRVGDINGDGRPDIFTAGKSGTHILYNKGRFR